MLGDSITVVSGYQIVRDFVHELRAKHGIVPGPSARGVGSDEMGDHGELVYDALPCSPDGTGRWKELLENEKLLANVVAFVESERSS